MNARTAAIALVSSALASCAQVTSIPLNMDGSEDKLPDGSAKVHGIRYYMPKPYLLVTELPAVPSSRARTEGDQGSAAARAEKEGNPGKGKNPSQENSQSQTAAPSAPTSDTSFTATMATYSMKLIYLPDYSRPMALQVRAGMFGSVSANPALQDGWMLGSLTSSVDSGAAAALTALGGFKPGSTGGATSRKGSGDAAAAQGAPDEARAPQRKPLNILTEQELRAYGRAVGKGDLQFPSESELSSLTEPKLKTLIKGIEIGIQIRSAVDAALDAIGSTPIWGPNVLPAGLYAFDYVNGVFSGLKPVTYFCKGGVQAAGQNEKAGSVKLDDKRNFPGYPTPCEHD
jgi:hypothetical protein